MLANEFTGRMARGAVPGRDIGYGDLEWSIRSGLYTQKATQTTNFV